MQEAMGGRSKGRRVLVAARRRSTPLAVTALLLIVAGCGHALAWDTFARSVTNGWGRAAPLGGSWLQVKGNPADLSVDGANGVFAIPAANYLSAEQIAILPSVSAQDYVGTFEVAFSDNVDVLGARQGGVVAYLVARYQNTSATGYYRLGLAWDGPSHHLWLRTQNAAGKGAPSDWTIQTDTGIDPANDYPAGGPYWYEMRVQIHGSSPTSFASKVWRLGTAEPAAWMLSGSDPSDLGPQVPGPVGVRASNDLQGTAGYLPYVAHISFTNIALGSLVAG